jgi:GNAT superfamily N-acetyltransferase
MKNLLFKPLIQHQPGTIFNLLKECYWDFINVRPDFSKGWMREWRDYDWTIFNYPDSVGICGFVSYLSHELVGFASWDPRKYPKGIIGHNCVLPQYRGHGYGLQQINEILNRFRTMEFQMVIVTTMDHEFFLPAQEMYLACGFKKTRRFIEENRSYYMLEYEKLLENKEEVP